MAHWDIFSKSNCSQRNTFYLSIRSESRGQFHQHSTCSFYIRKLQTQLFCAYFFRFVLYWRKTVGAKAAHRTLVKLTLDFGMSREKKAIIVHKWNWLSFLRKYCDTQQFPVFLFVPRPSSDDWFSEPILRWKDIAI